MRPEIVSAVVLVLLFVAGTILPVKLGAMGFMAAFLVGALTLDLAPDEISWSTVLLITGILTYVGVLQRQERSITRAAQ